MKKNSYQLEKNLNNTTNNFNKNLMTNFKISTRKNFIQKLMKMTMNKILKRHLRILKKFEAPLLKLQIKKCQM